MKLEAVIVCINYSDFLSHTLPYNKSFFERTVVVTDTKDIETHRVCERWNVMCIKTDAVYDNGAIVNKAIAINEGLKHLSKEGWIVQLDADIWLPPFFRNFIDKLVLDETCIYGIDRLMCNSYKDWYKFTHVNKGNIHQGWTFLRTDLLRMGVRIVHYNDTKPELYLPIGFFQLWNPKGSGVYTYPVTAVGYDRTDVLHAKQWAIGKRRFIPDFICVHLASEVHGQGQNWFGRKTIPFGQMNWFKWVWLKAETIIWRVWKWLEDFFKPLPPPYGERKSI
jgi:hypothetical protein